MSVTRKALRKEMILSAIALLVLSFVSSAEEEIKSSDQIEIVDSVLDEDFSNEIKREAEESWQEVEDNQDPDAWPRGKKTSSIIPMNVPILILLGIVGLCLLIISLVRRKKRM